MTEVPHEIIVSAFEVLELACQIKSLSKKHLWPDLSAAAELVQGASLAAGRIASANVVQIKDPRDRDLLEIEGGELIMKTFREAQKAQRSPGGKRKRP
jgi:formiminotetrahydrofolate cyclodeaminase